MIEEESLFPMKSVFLLIMIIALLAVIALAIYLFFTIRVEVSNRALDRANVEISDALVKSPLTQELAVFKKEELDRYDNTRAEPFVHQCKYGYSVKITSEKDSWFFGYTPDKPAKSIEDSSANFPVSVISDGNVVPAEMEVKVYDTWTTRIACLVEGAYLSRSVASDSFSCPGELFDNYNKCGFALRRMDGNEKSDYICLLDKTGEKDTDCRYLPGVPISEQSVFYSADRDDRILKAVPVRVKDAASAIGKPCSELEKLKANSGENAAVVLCFEEKKEDIQKGEVTFDSSRDMGGDLCEVHFTVKNIGENNWEQDDRIKVVLDCISYFTVPDGRDFYFELSAGGESYTETPNVYCPTSGNAEQQGKDGNWKIKLYSNCDDREENCGPFAKLLSEDNFRC